MTTALALVVGGYVAFSLVLAWRNARAPAPPEVADADLPSVAIVVAARNEEDCLARCLEALLAQQYPADRLQIIVADDHSTDGTARIVQRYVRERAPALADAAGAADAGLAEDEQSGAASASAAGPSVRYLRVPDPTGPLRGKAQALHVAIASTDAEVILTTDADCAPVPTWARAMAARFVGTDTGLVCGLARIETRPDHPLDRVQHLDWMLMLGAVSALAELRVPATGMGNNMAIRHAAYDETGGYPALPFSLTEDFTLVRAVADRTPWRVRFPLDARASVWTLPAPDFAEAYDQRRRWARGGLEESPWVLPVYTALFVSHALPLVALAVAPGAALAALAAKAVAHGVLLQSVLGHLGERLRLTDLLRFELFITGYLVTLPAVLTLRPHIHWKGRRH